jgi:hypothetical protein
MTSREAVSRFTDSGYWLIHETADHLEARGIGKSGGGCFPDGVTTQLAEPQRHFGSHA